MIGKGKKKIENNETVTKNCIRYNPDYKTGLTTAQVEEHKESGYANISSGSASKTTQDIIHENVYTYFNLIFTILAILLVVVGSYNNLTFLIIVVANTLIGIVQEIRAKKLLDNLSMLNAPKAYAIRNGEKVSVPTEELVLDDIVVLGAGNQVCADAVICDGDVQVNESLLTGESDEISKGRGDILLSGSFIVSGQCYARLEKVGEDSYISKLTMQAKKMKSTEQSEMIASLNKLVKTAGIAIIPIGLILFFQTYYLNGQGFRESIISMVAAVIGMIPEGLYLLATIALAVSTMKLTRDKVLLHDMKCIETLARVDVLCVDKTGTITDSVMKVQGVIATRNYNDTMLPLNVLIGDFASAMENDNITMSVIKGYFSTVSDRKPSKVTGFSSVTKYSSAEFEDGTYVLGAPEFVLKDDYEIYKNEILQQASKGIRVLVFGRYDGTVDGGPLEKPVVPLAYLLLANPIREKARETFQYFKEQGVDIKVISGDNPATVSEIARQAGIENVDSYVDASKITTDEEMRHAVLNYTVFGRVTPDQKRKFVQILKEEGRTVAMTGDGVNDILALKDADCSIAMASGSDAVAQASQLVLLESDFSKMPEVVYEGRRVVNNIQRSATLFIVKNIFSFLLSVFSIIFMATYPLQPSQISLISMFTIGIPGFFLALESNKNIIKGHFISNVLMTALPAALTNVIVVGAMIVYGEVFDLSEADISTASTILLAVVGFMILRKISTPLNKLRTGILIGCIAGIIFAAVFFKEWFAMSMLSVKSIMILILLGIATEPVFRYLTCIIEKIRFYYGRLRGKNKAN